MNCCLCLNINGVRQTATITVQGYSVCDAHALEDVWVKNGDNSLNLTATVQRHRGTAHIGGHSA